ncbi:Signal transduction histidine kinase [Selenomonas sp. GACV-9]|uniref:hybrid sensor histidine kinase/response regulator n=1 Tax=Selenomonas sp. GACV-9 TaxID=3158782 RepID=UPI0008F186C1|nr:Signal transduction histidine kinase [Selenomonas ruminantium]
MNEITKENGTEQLPWQKSVGAVLALSDDYTSVYCVNLADGTMTAFTTQDVFRAAMDEPPAGPISYTEGLSCYAERQVYPLDRLRVRAVASLAYVSKMLKENRTYTITFSLLINQEVHFAEMKFVRLEESEGKITSVVLGIHENDEQIGSTMVHQHIIKEVEAIFFCDLNQDILRVYKKPQMVPLPDDKMTISYSRTMTYLLPLAGAEQKEMLKNLANPQFVKEFIADEESREFVYELPECDNPWRRALFQIYDRGEDGKAARVIVSFSPLDYNRAKEFEMAQRLQHQSKELAKQHEQLELALHQANAANQAKTHFLTNMSHDIRTPMNAIMGYTALAAAHLNDTACVHGYLDKISTASDHLLSIINDVLDMSRIESGKLMLDVSENSFADIVEELTNILQPDMDTQQLSFQVDTQTIVNESIYCDRLRLNQVLLNCLSNAVKFTKPGGTVSLEISQDPQAPAGYGSFTFVIRDTGIGMAPEFVAHIFEPFTRERTSTQSRIQGTGLGMAIVKNLVDMMGGDISVWSEPGTGTEITINLLLKLIDNDKATKSVGKPANAASEEGRKSNNSLESRSNVLQEQDDLHGHVLLVEDNEINAEIVYALLENTDIKIDLAENGAIAVDMVQQAPEKGYDLVLMDLQMPVMNGLDASRAIRSLPSQWTHDVPILAMTANAFDEDRKAAMESGMNDYILKPIDLPNLFQKLHEYLD